MLAAFKNLKNSKGQPVQPLYNQGFLMVEQQLCGSYGLGDNGLNQVTMQVYNPGDGKLKYMYTDDKMKQLWQQAADWYKAGYIPTQSITSDTGIDYTKWVADGTAGLVGCYSWVGANYLYSTAPDDYAAINALQGPGGQVLSWCDTPCRGIVSGIITTKDKYVNESLQWMDYWYGTEGSQFAQLGTPDVTYTYVNGLPRYNSSIMDYKGGWQLGALQWGLQVYGGYTPSIDPPPYMQYSSHNSSALQNSGSTVEDVQKYKPKTTWPSFIATASELTQLTVIQTDINKYLTQARINFITGKWNFTTDWDNYVAQLNKMGLSTFMSIRQAEYDRYIKSLS